MNDNTTMVLLVALTLIWNVILLGGTVYVILTFNVSWWLLILACFFVIFPKSKANE